MHSMLITYKEKNLFLIISYELPIKIKLDIILNLENLIGLILY